MMKGDIYSFSSSLRKVNTKLLSGSKFVQEPYINPHTRWQTRCSFDWYRASAFIWGNQIKVILSTDPTLTDSIESIHAVF